MMESSNLNLDLHHQEDFHDSSSSLAIPWNQDLIHNNTHEIPMVHELGFQWDPTCINGEGYLMSQEEHISKNVKGELEVNLQDYSLMPSHVKFELNQINGLIQPSFEPMNLGNNNGRGSFSMVLPSANVCNLNYLNGLYTSSIGMPPPSLNSMTNLLREDLAYNGSTLDQLQEPTHAAVSTSHHKVPHSSVSGVTEAKRSLDCKITSPPPSKKPRLESRTSFTPFKVRKEKLGDRIAALQQLVAPFGKTDTASVLMEAIGYIKFLQDQVETLSVPYMNSLNDMTTRSSQGGSGQEKEEQKPGLRSRGLCLVPLSCMSYVTNENGGGWPPSNCRGGT